MPEKFQKKYRIPSARLQDWDYGSDGIYFVTICTQKRECYFGDVVNGKMELSEIGEIVKTEWDKSFQIRAELFCDISVIMPNHIHAILIINNNDFDDAHGVETHGRASLRPPPPPPQIKSGIAYRSPRSISSFVAGFKSTVTKQARNIHADFAWQSRFYDHIIRTNQSYQNISEYIQDNPINWHNDKFCIAK